MEVGTSLEKGEPCCDSTNRRGGVSGIFEKYGRSIGNRTLLLIHNLYGVNNPCVFEMDVVGGGRGSKRENNGNTGECDKQHST